MHSREALAFLKQLEAEIPPPPGQHHSMTYSQYGSDETGWSDRLCIQIRYSSGSQNFIYGPDEDLETGLQEIREFMKERR